jgi:hypothetical protein
MLSIGIEYGAFREGGKIDEVKRFGAAKILALRGKEEVSGDGIGDDGMAEEEIDVVNEEVIEDAPVVDIEKTSEGNRAPEMRYVYTMKVSTVERQEIKVYRYSIPLAAQRDIVNTRKKSVKTSVAARPFVYISAWPEGPGSVGTTVGTSDPDLSGRRPVLTRAPATRNLPGIFVSTRIDTPDLKEKAAPASWNGFSTLVRTSSG